MEAIHGLPLDILRLLFEFSASTSIESAKVLSLVSKEVQHWTDPYLFDTIHEVYGGFSWESKTLLGQMFKSDISPRIARARSYVRTLAWFQFVSHESYIKHALEVLPNLTELHLLGNIFPFQSEEVSGEHFEITQIYPSLRRMATCIDEACVLPPNAFGSPFWTSITHLQIEYLGDISSNVTAFQLPLFTAMTSLTHLALSSSSFERVSNVRLALSRVRETFPPSLILRLLGLISPLFQSYRHQLVEMTDTYLKSDERIVMWWTDPRYDIDETVVVSRTDSFEGSCRIQGGVPTFWEMGEAVLKRRQERLQAI